MQIFSLKAAACSCICAAPLASLCTQRLGCNPVFTGRLHENLFITFHVRAQQRNVSFCSVNNLLFSAELSRSVNVHNVPFYLPNLTSLTLPPETGRQLPYLLTACVSMQQPTFKVVILPQFEGFSIISSY